jgi:ERCC4-related helicase
MIEAVEELSREEYRVEDMIDETIDDLVTVADFLQELQKFKVEHDDKLKALLKLLKTDSVLQKHKVIIFSEYMATAHRIISRWPSASRLNSSLRLIVTLELPRRR